ncbi:MULTISPECIES: hypothetical protein [Bacillus amyloliquefaciens group]|uniref:hypothetical protein n=1 Tax=Bacillus amyloliquefaciens group TaxID=1938374 RepID=UPI000396064F|nr:MULTISPECIES: hypothetical protein [Bacillus amyloliquefaciens group]ERH55288.1 hypothetical protein O205_21240 [Bacillus amyloliquefaciens EGD-AQ14]MDH3087212.1 DUF1056 domain-containing protein [Bacillus velezensis]MEC0405735.1 DUF1056 domain-containing protein [Bacillus velezensis]
MKIFKIIYPFIEDVFLLLGMFSISLAAFKINTIAGLITTGGFLFLLAWLTSLSKKVQKEVKE